jgi:carboxylesterase
MELIPGAEPWSVEGGPLGALCLHGFTGNPSSMRPVAEAFAAAGFAVELPRLPGHGTTVADMIGTGWDDWSAEVEAAYQRLAVRCRSVVVAGLSMGGTLTVWLATRHPEIAGIVPINPATTTQPDEVLDMVRGMLEEGTTVLPGIGSDIAKEGVVETAYPETPLAPLLSLQDAIAAMQADLPRITCPVLLMTSPQDHVVDPASSDHLAASVSGPVERVALERSFHVATLDHDAELICERAVAFARRVTGG